VIEVVVERRRKWAHWDWITWLYVLLILARSLVINPIHVFFTIEYFNPLDWVLIFENSIHVGSNYFKTIIIL
jgi:hypothetical protein